MEFGKQHDTTDTTAFYACRLVKDLLQGKWYNGFEENLLPESCQLVADFQTGVLDFGRYKAAHTYTHHFNSQIQSVSPP